MKKLILLFGAAMLMCATLFGCGSSNADTQNDASEENDAKNASAKDFDGSNCVDTGEGTMIISTPGGTSEGGNIPQVAGSKDIALTQFTVELEGMDNSICTLYVDGMENDKFNACDTQRTFTLYENDLTEGIHTVELVRMDGDTVEIYKSAQYEIVF